MATTTRESWLDRIPYTPLLHLLALSATFAVIVADFVISLRNMKINQENWDKFHDFLPFVYLWAAGQFTAKRFSAWKTAANGGDETTSTTTTTTTTAAPAEPTRSEIGKPPAAGQPALPASEVTTGDTTTLQRPDHAG